MMLGMHHSTIITRGCLDHYMVLTPKEGLLNGSLSLITNSLVKTQKIRCTIILEIAVSIVLK